MIICARDHLITLRFPTPPLLLVLCIRALKAGRVVAVQFTLKYFCNAVYHFLSYYRKGPLLSKLMFESNYFILKIKLFIKIFRTLTNQIFWSLIYFSLAFLYFIFIPLFICSATQYKRQKHKDNTEIPPTHKVKGAYNSTSVLSTF